MHMLSSNSKYYFPIIILIIIYFLVNSKPKLLTNAEYKNNIAALWYCSPMKEEISGFGRQVNFDTLVLYNMKDLNNVVGIESHMSDQEGVFLNKRFLSIQFDNQDHLSITNKPFLLSQADSLALSSVLKEIVLETSVFNMTGDSHWTPIPHAYFKEVYKILAMTDDAMLAFQTRMDVDRSISVKLNIDIGDKILSCNKIKNNDELVKLTHDFITTKHVPTPKNRIPVSLIQKLINDEINSSAHSKINEKIPEQSSLWTKVKKYFELLGDNSTSTSLPDTSSISRTDTKVNSINTPSNPVINSTSGQSSKPSLRAASLNAEDLLKALYGNYDVRTERAINDQFLLPSVTGRTDSNPIRAEAKILWTTPIDYRGAQHQLVVVANREIDENGDIFDCTACLPVVGAALFHPEKDGWRAIAFATSITTISKDTKPTLVKIGETVWALRFDNNYLGQGFESTETTLIALMPELYGEPAHFIQVLSLTTRADDHGHYEECTDDPGCNAFEVKLEFIPNAQGMIYDLAAKMEGIVEYSNNRTIPTRSVDYYVFSGSSYQRDQQKSALMTNQLTALPLTVESKNNDVETFEKEQVIPPSSDGSSSLDDNDQDQILSAYTARLSNNDHVSSQGVELNKAFAILMQDRANYYKFGKRDFEDEGDNYFADKKNREAIEKLFDLGKTSTATSNAIVSGNPVVRVELRKGAEGLYLTAKLQGQSD